MKRLAAIGAALLVAGVASGCSSSSTAPSPTPTPTQSPSSSKSAVSVTQVCESLKPTIEKINGISTAGAAEKISAAQSELATMGAKAPVGLQALLGALMASLSTLNNAGAQEQVASAKDLVNGAVKDIETLCASQGAPIGGTSGSAKPTAS
ncbi:MAG: hypothetical protein WCP28_19550 [Actinomycetes bacterium]